jgi:hypothetical protein
MEWPQVPDHRRKTVRAGILGIDHGAVAPYGQDPAEFTVNTRHDLVVDVVGAYRQRFFRVKLRV